MLELLKTSQHCAQMDLCTECKNILMLELTADNACDVFKVANSLQIEVKFWLAAIQALAFYFYL